MSKEIDKLASDIAAAQAAAKKSGMEPVKAYRRVFGAFLDHLLQMPGDLVGGIRSQITNANSDLLLGAARSSAIWSIRDQDTTWFILGLGALLLENGQRDYRESITEASLMMRSAQKLQTSLEADFDKVRRLGDGSSTALHGIENVIKKGINDIGLYGYVEAVDRAGFFTYKQDRP